MVEHYQAVEDRLIAGYTIESVETAEERAIFEQYLGGARWLESLLTAEGLALPSPARMSIQNYVDFVFKRRSHSRRAPPD